MYKSCDPELAFCIDLMDSIHCHWYHLYDTGMRVKVDEEEKSSVDDDDYKYFDAEFYLRSKAIRKAQKYTKKINGFDARYKGDKFMLQFQNSTGTLMRSF